jgi:hypothetical protein
MPPFSTTQCFYTRDKLTGSYALLIQSQARNPISGLSWGG